MKEGKKEIAQYIEELEDAIVTLKFKVKNAEKDLLEEKKANHTRIQKCVHDLKNPIGVIYSFSEMITEGGDAISADKRSKFNDVIYNSSKYSIAVLNAVSLLNKLNSAEYKLQIEKQHYVTFVKEEVEKFKVKNAGIKLSVSGEENNAVATIDKDAFSKVLQHIFTNAVVYSEKKAVINIDIKETENTVETIISDNGIGILETDLPNIFNEFFMVNTYNVKGEKCVGLGLSIVKKIIEKHFGKVAAISELDKGTTITISIPKT